nr:LLM class flavin-dependent oxidoreductase [Dactylosporangium thailandense]
MRIGLQFFLQLPRPWSPGAECQLIENALAQMELADALGYSHAWFAEQHFLEEYSHSSAPELILAAAARTTSQIRLGHAVVLTPPPYNSPVRVAERLATLDLISHGRVDFGFGNSKSRMELEGFGVDPALRQEMTLEAVEQIAAMMSREPYPGHTGRFLSMPARNVIPKPVQRPHPPLWMACSTEASVLLAARLGVGALAHTFADPDEARRIVTAYYETFRNECVPISATVNPNVAMLMPFHCEADGDAARARGLEAHGYFTFALRHYYSFGRHRPGRTDISELYEATRREMGGDPVVGTSTAFGTPDQVADYLAEFAAAGLDQAVLLHDAGGLSQQAVLASLEMFGRAKLPRFAEQDARRQRRKDAELAPFVAQALDRRARDAGSGASTAVEAYGRNRPSPSRDGLTAGQRAQLERLDELKRVAMAVEQDAADRPRLD